MLFSRVDPVTSPFPYGQCMNALPQDVFEALEVEFPTSKYFNSKHDAHGSLRLGMPEFDEFLRESPAWSHFVDQINTKAFADHCLSLFADDLKNRGALVDRDNYRFSTRSAPPYRTRKRSLSNAYYYVKRGLELSPARRWLNEAFGRDELYLQLTVSHAGIGYGKQIHRDRAHQVVLMLVYFDDLEQCGGELQLYRPRPEASFANVNRKRIPEELVEPVVTLPCLANSGVIMLNTDDSFHAVSSMDEGAPSRRFMGIALSKRYTRDAWRPNANRA